MAADRLGGEGVPDVICAARTAYFLSRPEHRQANGLPDGALPHVFGSRKRVNGGEWSTPKCSWCGQVKT